MTRVQSPPDRVQEAIHYFETNTLPSVRKAPGNEGAGLWVNRKTGEAVGITYWESAKALADSEHVGIDARMQAARNVPGTQIVNVERAELMMMERVGPPKTGLLIRLASGAGDPARVDASVRYIRTNELPLLKAQEGFRVLIIYVDRLTGRYFVASVWDTLADLEASETNVASVLAEAAKAAGISPENINVEIFEAARVELSAALLAQIAKD